MENAQGIAEFMLRLRGHGILDARILKAIEDCPHSAFVPVQFFDKSWQSVSLPLPCGQTMTSPDILARMIAAFPPHPSHTVLEIGTGSGYATAVLAKLAKKVRSVDRYRCLVDEAKLRTQALEINNISFAQADGNNTNALDGLYDLIFCDCAYQSVPRHLLELLTAGGVVVTAIGEPASEQMLVRLTKIGSRFEREDLFPVRFGRLESGVAGSL